MAYPPNMLPYRLRQTVDIVQVNDLYEFPLPLDIQSYPQEGVNLYIVPTDADTYKKLVSSVLVGASLRYPDEVDKIMTAISYPLSRNTNICQIVFDCIQDNDAIRDLISGIAAQEKFEQSQQPLASQPNANETVTNTDNGCNKDAIFAQTVFLADMVNEVIVDALQIWDAADSEVGLAANILSATAADDVVTGGLSGIPTALMEFASWVRETAIILYEAGITVSWLNDVACAYMCIAVENGCEISPAIMLEYHANALVEAGFTLLEDILNDNLFEIFEKISALDSIAAENVAHAMYAVFWGSVGLFSFLNIDREFVFAGVQAFADESNNNWQQLCDPCPSDVVCELPAFINFDDMNRCISLTGAFNDPSVLDVGSPRFNVANIDAVFLNNRTRISMAVLYSLDNPSVVNSVSFDSLINYAGNSNTCNFAVKTRLNGVVVDSVQLSQQSSDGTWTNNIVALSGGTVDSLQISIVEAYGIFDNFATGSYAQVDNIDWQ